MIILDTNVLSAVMQSTPHEAVVAWLNRQPASSIWTTAITVFEIEYGLQRLPAGKRRTGLETAFRSVLTEDLGGRILAFDAQAALAAGAISAALESDGSAALAADGQAVDVRDVQIAGIARARQAIVATRNVKHFERACSVTNPWDDA